MRSAMGKNRLVSMLAVAICTAAVGCASEGDPRTVADSSTWQDAGAADASPMMDADLEDAALLDGSMPVDAPSDAGVDADTGPTYVDGGGVGGDCVLYVPRGSFGPLTPACLPRCTVETGRAYEACTNAGCRSRVTEADETPGVRYYIGTASVRTPLDCAGCVAYQEMHCFSRVCPTQVDSYVDACIAGIDDRACDLALSRLDTCLGGLTTTQVSTLEACMYSEEGAAGCY